ncbi:MAG: hypothetical protein O3B13_20980 [Planctomycetota bacterium]|nr:hypothetical protein [Planctomycetota bacterium]
MTRASGYRECVSPKDWAAGRAYSWHNAVLITAKIADALAHAQSMVHRDVCDCRCDVSEVPSL